MKISDLKITHERMDKILKIIKACLSIYLIFSALSQIFYRYIGIIDINPISLHTHSTVVELSAIILFSSIFIKKLNSISLFILTIAISIIGAFQQNSVYLFYVLPVILSLYTFNKRLILHTSITTGIFFIISVNLRAYEIIKAAPLMSQSFIVYVTTSIIAIFETIIIILAAVPLFIYLINSDQYQWKYRQEKTQAQSDILNFCSAVSVYHNKYLEAHINGVKEITKVLLDKLNENGVTINKYYYRQILFSVQFHDIGKTYIPASILEKPGRLTKDEYKLIQEHPQRGLELLELLPRNTIEEHTFDICKNIVYQHHERRDGSGYPQGLKGNEIRFEAEIVAVADVIDALLAWRPYKKPMTWESAIKIFNKDYDKYNAVCLKALFESKDEILAISDKNNKKLQEIFELSNTDIERHN